MQAINRHRPSKCNVTTPLPSCVFSQKHHRCYHQSSSSIVVQPSSYSFSLWMIDGVGLRIRCVMLNIGVDEEEVLVKMEILCDEIEEDGKCGVEAKIEDEMENGEEQIQSSEQERLTVEFWREADILFQASSSKYGSTMATVAEYMVDGSLRHVYLDHRKRLKIAMDAAFGMEYLHSKKLMAPASEWQQQ
ncbi:hypothetical protein V8G54_021964 [Vigna mungo]|uniref:Uncharacterized protein n=1 Tax=Vigna mungo TaxID=3915 RepID=A0AAQ3NIC8_VIGMU